MSTFRTRLMLLTVLLSGAVLAVFGVATWLLSYRLALGRLDGDIREHARRELNDARRPGYPQRSDHNWHSEYGGGRDRVRLLILLRQRDDGHVVFKSAEWPANVAEADLPNDVATPPEDATPPMDGPRGGPGQMNPPALGPPVTVAHGRFVTIRRPDGAWRVGIAGSHRVTAVVGVPLKPLHDDLERLAGILLTAFVPGLLLIAACGWIFAGRAMRPVIALTRAAETITAQGLDRRLEPVRNAEEFSRLTLVFNDMLERLQRSFGQATRFSADAAHELKTPLTILQGQIEESLRAAPDGSDQQRLCAGLLEEVQRLKSIVRKLLLLALADAGQLKLNREPLDLSEMAGGAVEDARILAPALRIETEIAPDVKAEADPDLLAQVFQNLVSNAIKYNKADGFVRLELSRDSAGVRLAVVNSGPVIPEAERERIFERFYRADPSRARTVEGIGLGLSLAREIVRAHGGELVLERSDESGTCFAVKLPG